MTYQPFIFKIKSWFKSIAIDVKLITQIVKSDSEHNA